MATKAQVAKSKRTPKYSSRIVRRCELTGRARGVYRKFRISRIMLRKLALEGKIPGMRNKQAGKQSCSSVPFNRSLYRYTIIPWQSWIDIDKTKGKSYVNQ